MCVCVPRVCLVPQKSEEDVKSRGTGVIDGCELPVGVGNQMWVLGKTMLLTAEPAFQHFLPIS